MKPALVSRLNLFFLIYSVVAIVVTLFVHGSLYFGFNLRTTAPNLWTVIQLSLLVTVAGVVFCYRHSPTFTKELYTEHSTVLLWLTIFLTVFLFYAIFNVFYWDRWLHFGYLDFREGHYVIVNRGRIVRSLLSSEVPAYQFYQARKYSGHWMICNTVLCLFAFMNVKFGSGGPVDKKEALKDASSLYEVERRALYGERPGFRISELQISPAQSVPWHFHNNIDDTFYVVAGEIRLFLRDPHENVRLAPGDSYRVKAGRPHLVANDGEVSATFVILQGIGEYDYVPFSLD